VGRNQLRERIFSIIRAIQLIILFILLGRRQIRTSENRGIMRSINTRMGENMADSLNHGSGSRASKVLGFGQGDLLVQARIQDTGIGMIGEGMKSMKRRTLRMVDYR
ncbi:hypothetical protein KI387_039842, partial [Taxus chinensis]